MRALKFRAWDGTTMHYQGSFCFNQAPIGFLMPESHINIFAFDGIESGEIITGDALEKAEVMQFTGLFDSLDNEICEGDIINLIYWNKQVETFLVFWYTPAARFMLRDKNGETWGLSQKNDMQVIGNFYEHPHLLQP